MAIEQDRGVIELNKRVVERMLTAFNSPDDGVIDELVAIDHVDETPFPGTEPDRNGLKTQIKALHRAFPGVRFSLEKMLAEGDQVAFRWRMEGVHRSRQAEASEGGQPFVFHGNDFVTLREGKIVQHLSADNVRELLAGLGISRPGR